MKRQKAQVWLNQNYPKEERSSIKKLDISNKGLEGELKLDGFDNLEKLDCSNNLITKLELENDSVVKLVKLNIRNNNFSEQDLTYFSGFVNLKKLYLSNTKEKVLQKYYNQFCGSLEPLKNLTQLEELYISNTNIDHGLEHLPKSLEKIYCANDLGIGGGCEKIRKKLKNYLGKTPFWSKQYYEYYDLRKWRKYQEITEKVKKDNNEMSLIALSHHPLSLIDDAVHRSSVGQRKVQQAQKWLNKNYLKEERSGYIKLDISFLEIGEILEGSLNLTDFENLRLLNCSGHKITELEFGYHPQLSSTHPQLGVLYCNENKLTKLSIRNFPLLTNIDCSENQLANLTISNCPKLTELYCSNNRLTKFDFSKLNEEKLTHLDLNNNIFSPCDLSALVDFINLRSIKIGSSNNQEKINKGSYNHFSGSLKYLKDMTKLEVLNINATDINEGLDYLPESLVEFYGTTYGTVTNVEEIEEELKNYPALPQVQTLNIPQSQSQSITLLGVGKTEAPLSGLFSSLGPNYIGNLRRWRKARRMVGGSEISRDNFSMFQEFDYEESQSQLEEQTQEENSTQTQIEIPPKKI